VTGAFDGLPHARALRSVIDEAWASPHLPVRSKALVFAVIARGLGSLDCEREARRLLAAEDEVFTDDAVDDMLANLASPLLTAAETRILPYVRETIRYQPAPVQRRGRALREKLNNAEFVETVGAAALANMVCRIALATDPR
jgi:alkylhydroperoxidase family enzyme